MICKNCGKECESQLCQECQTLVKDNDVKALDKCPNCGADRIDNGKFCINCGFNFEENDRLAEKKQAYENLVENSKSNKFLQVFAKIYRFLLPIMLLIASTICFWGLGKPVIVYRIFETSYPATDIGWVEATKEVKNIFGVYSIFLMGVAVLSAVYGIIHLIIAIKKPYLTVKKLAVWIIDFLICAMLVALGAVVKVMETEKNDIGYVLGSGYVASIVIGVIGIVMLAIRIFYEVKLFKWQDTGLEYEKVVDVTKKKKNEAQKAKDKQKRKRNLKIFGVSMAVLVVILAIVIPSVVYSSNIFRVGKVQQVSIGISKDDVIDILGSPYSEGDVYEYYSKNYLKVKKQIQELEYSGRTDGLEELYQQLGEMDYKYIRVEFEGYGRKVSSVFFDNNRNDSKLDGAHKQVKSYEVHGETSVEQYDMLDLSYEVKYDDGSFYKAIAISMACLDKSQNSASWQDAYGNEFTSQISVTNCLHLTSDMIKAVADNDITSLTEFVIPNTVESIERQTFSYCYRLTSIVIPESVKIMGAGIFYGCRALTVYCEATSKPDGWDIDWNSQSRPVVWNCNNNDIADDGIIYVVTDGGIRCAIKDGEATVAQQSRYLEGDIIIPSSVEYKDKIYKITSICEEAFDFCSRVTSIEISSSIKSIGDSAFSNCKGLTSVEMQNGLDSISSYAFYNCESLTSVYIPSSVTSIQSGVFIGCSALNYIYCELDSQPSGWDKNWNRNYEAITWWGYKRQ